MPRFLTTFIVVLLSIGPLLAQQTKEDSLRSLLASATSDSDRFELTDRLAEEFRRNAQWDSAEYYFGKLLSNALQSQNDEMIVRSYFSLGAYFDGLSDYARSLSYMYKGLELAEKMNDHSLASRAYNNLSWSFVQLGDYEQAIEDGRLALFETEKVGEPLRSSVASYIYNNMSIAYSGLGMPDSALYYNDKAYAGLGTARSSMEVRCWVLAQYGAIYNAMGNPHRADSSFQLAMKLAVEHDFLQAFVFSAGDYCEMLNGLGRYTQSIRVGKKGLEYGNALLFKRYLIDISEALHHAYGKMGRTDSALYYAELYIGYTRSLFSTERENEIHGLRFDREISEVETANELALESKSKEIRKEKVIRNYLLLGLLVVGLLAMLIYLQRNRLSKEKRRSDALLLNILPAEIAEELKATGEAAARDFDQVSILFTDFKNFTMLAEGMNPEELVSELNHCFKAFDHICEKHGIEKIKTLGDSYMAATGLPVPSADSAQRLVLAGLEMQAFVETRKVELGTTGQQPFEMRAGIHSGKVVAGIVGVKKFQYDVWGDTVNTASRMESHGEVGKVNISQATYELVRDDPRFDFVHRGKVEAKGKGEVDMYFVSLA